MPDPTTLIAGANLFMAAKERQQRKELAEQMNDQAGDNADMPLDNRQMENIADDQSETVEKLEKLIEIESKNKPTTGDKDAYASAVVSLDAGQTAEVTVEPLDGYNLRVKRIEFDRRDNHDYTLNVGGDVTSVNHRAKYTSPKLVSQSDRVMAVVTNNGSSTTTFDFEMAAWAEESSGRF